MKIDFSDFTTDIYRDMVRCAKSRFRFRLFTEYNSDTGNVLWRHDVDFSPHRALRLAQIEAEEGVVATYFWHLQSSFYNCLEPAVLNKITEIAEMGHAVGLHFDVGARRCGDPESLLAALRQDRDILSNVSGHDVLAVSFHNPTIIGVPIPACAQVSGMVNVYSDDIKGKYTYCSDSNGYWRFRRLQDVIEDESVVNLHALTHPAWWTDEPLSPHQKIWRCLDGRCARVKDFYLSLLRKSGREDVK